MTITYLSLDKSLSSLDSLVIPSEVPDVKAKLSQLWTFWLQTETDNEDYKNATKSLVNFDSIESFWACFAAIPQPSAFLQGRTFLVENRPVNSIMIFRGDVAPEWEDPSNAEGGHFQFQWKSAGVSPAQLDEYWNNIILALIGNTIEAEGEFSVCPILQGARFVDKSNASGKLAGVRIEIWFSKPIDARHLQKVRSRLDKAMTTHLDGTTGVNPRCDVRYHSNRQH